VLPPAYKNTNSFAATAMLLFFLHVPKRKHHYFPCINDHQVIEEEEPQEPKAITLIYKNE